MPSTTYLDTAAVARLMGVRVETVRTHIWRGTIPEPDLRIGRSPAWKRSTIDQWLKTRRLPGHRAVDVVLDDPAEKLCPDCGRFIMRQKDGVTWLHAINRRESCPIRR